jgi:hypothetical protein
MRNVRAFETVAITRRGEPEPYLTIARQRGVSRDRTTNPSTGLRRGRQRFRAMGANCALTHTERP